MKVCLVTGKFKVLHVGHLRLLKTASEITDRLVVAIDDSNVEKDELAWRINLITHTEFVDEVITFSGDVCDLIRTLKPDFVVKGNEFSKDKNLEQDELDKYGGKLVFSSGNYTFSETPKVNDIENFVKHDENFLKRHKSTRRDYLELLNSFSKLKVCVIGDLIFDEYIECKPVGASQENPSIVVTPVQQKLFIGGAGIVAKHCESLGAHTYFIGVIGNDEIGNWCRNELVKSKIEVNLYNDDSRKSTIKTRYKVGNQVMFRLNQFTNTAISKDIENKILDAFEANCKNYDLLIFSDFSYGTLSSDLVSRITQLCKQNNVMIAADSQSSSQIGNLSKFTDVDLITPTEREARIEVKDETSGLVILAENLRRKIQSKNIILKLGSDGLIIHSFNYESDALNETDQIKALNFNPVNVSGAGDSLLACASMALASGANIFESAYLGSIAAAIHVSTPWNTELDIINLRNIISLM